MFDTEDSIPPEARRFVRPDRDATWIDAGYADNDLETVRETAAREFQGANPNIANTFELEALQKSAKAAFARLASLQSAHRAADALETVVSHERISKSHWVIRLAGLLVGLLGILLMLPLPLVVGAGIEESLSIERIVEEPYWALLYGFAPFGAVIATHGLRDALKTDRSRRRFDLLIYFGTIAAFGAWCWSFGPTFLVDVLSDPSAASQAGSLADFYRFHLLLEILGASSAYIAAMHMLTSGARKVSKISEARQVLAEAIRDETRTCLEIARACDVVSAKPETYSSAQMAYQDHAVLRAQVARKLLAAKFESESVHVLAELRAAMTHTAKEETHD